MPLRIFEPRYIRMVKEACAQNTGFAICMVNAKGDEKHNQHIYPIGTYVRVVDFDLLPDGMLGITVEGVYCIKISSVQSDKDGLRIGECEALNSWPTPANPGESLALSERLQEIFEKYPELNKLYPEPLFNDPVWVIYRWLELLPIEADKKQMLLNHKDHVQAWQFLTHFTQ